MAFTLWVIANFGMTRVYIHWTSFCNICVGKKKVEQDFSKSLGLEKFIWEVIVKSLVGELPKREKAFVKLRGIFVRYPSVGR